MKIALKYLLVSVLVFCSSISFGKDRIRRDADTTFQINYFDTTYTRDVAFRLRYDDSDGSKPYTLIMKVDSSASDTQNTDYRKEISVKFAFPLDLQAVDKELNKNILHRYGVPKTITQFTVYQIFIWMSAKASNERTLAGVLLLGNYVKIYKKDTNIQYDERVAMVDKLTEKLKLNKINTEKRETELAKQLERVNKVVNDDLEIKKKTNDLNRKIKDSATVSMLSDVKSGSDPNELKALNLRYKITDLKENDITDIVAIKKSYYEFTTSKNVVDKDIVNKFKNAYKRLSAARILRTEDGSEYDMVAALYEKIKGIDVLPINAVDTAQVKAINSYLDNKLSDLTSELAKRIKDSSDLVRKIVNDRKNVVQKSNEESEGVFQSKKNIDSAKATTNQLEKIILDADIRKIDRIDFQFERGFLENIKVILKIDNRDVLFENNFAIGFTSKYNYRQIAFIKLYARLGDRQRYIYLSDVLRNYDNEIDLFTRDYSPADTLVKIDPSKFPRVELDKATSINLFETKYMTDLDGLADKQPNGLVQFEISKRVNLFTKRYQVKSDLNDGFCNYINIYGTLNKIENRNRFLSLRNKNVVANNTLMSPSYASNLDFLQYRNLSVGMDVNVFVFDAPTWKTTTTLDFGVVYGHTPVRDSSRKIDAGGILTATGDTTKLNANLATFFPKLTIQVFSERRIGFSISYQPLYTTLLSNNLFKQVSSYAKSNTSVLPIEPSAHWAHMFEFFLKLELNPKTSSKLFFRSRFYWQQGDANTFFPQIQFGYSYNVNFQKP